METAYLVPLLLSSRYQGKRLLDESTEESFRIAATTT